MIETNILITSAGRRVELIQLFKQAKEKLNISGKVIAADMSKKAPALYHAGNYYQVPAVDDAKFISILKDICLKENIDLIIPTIDTELPYFSEYQEESLLEADFMISNQEAIGICASKDKTHQFFEEKGFGTPEVISEKALTEGNYELPLFIKPKDGSSSENTFLVESDRQLNFFKSYVPNPIILEYVDGQEFTIDAFADFNCRPVTAVPRIRLETRGGEISKGKVVRDESIIEDVKRMIKTLGLKGPITAQCIKNKNGENKFIEINPRYGGGAPISITAGANTPRYIYKLLNGDFEGLNYDNDFKEGLIALRYDQAVFLDSEGDLLQK